MNYKKSEQLLDRALKSIPLASQTFSKSLTTYPRGVSPFFIEKGKGSKVSNQLKNNEVRYYESYNKEIKGMKYLIEYMCKNNNTNKTI